MRNRRPKRGRGIKENAMGYTTKFDGRFDLDKLPPAEVIVRLRELEGIDGRDMEDPCAPKDGYCQWQLTKDCRGIEWDHGEKFYNYVEWLQYLIDNVLTPHDVTLSGSVNYSGEEADDNGVLVVENGSVRQVKHREIAISLEGLHEFKKFVESHKYGYEIIRDWQKEQKRKR
jgi:hypothetical protein